MKKTSQKSGGRRGRPRSRSRSELTKAQIQRADALSRRTARRIRAFLDAHVPAVIARAESASSGRVIARQLLPLAARLAPRIATMNDPQAVHRLLATELRAALTAAADALQDAPAPQLVYPDVKRPGRLALSKDLASARARGARLHATWLDLMGQHVTSAE